MAVLVLASAALGLSVGAGRPFKDLLFVTESEDPCVIGFDGSSFTGGFATVLESGFNHAWSAISIIAEAPVTAGPAPAMFLLIALALLLLGVVPHRLGGRQRRLILPYLSKVRS